MADSGRLRKLTARRGARSSNGHSAAEDSALPATGVMPVAPAPASAPADGSPSPQPVAAGGVRPAPAASAPAEEAVVDLERRRDQLRARVAELQWDLGGLVYEMAIREQVRVDVIVKRAAVLQDADAELGEVERILRMEQTATAGACPSCNAPHSIGAAFCWQCGHPLLRQVTSDAIFAP